MTLYQQLLLFIGLGVYTASSMSADLTLDGGSEHFQYLKPTGANRNLTLNAPGTTAGVPSIQGLWYIIRCDPTASYSVVVKSGTTLVTLAAGDWAIVACGGANGSAAWKVMASSAGLATLTLTGALSAASAAFTGALTAQTATFSGQTTTTDGVISGNARIVGGNVHTKQSSTTLTNSTTETTLATHTLPANMIKAGTTVRIRGAVRVTGNASADTLTMKVRLGGTAIITTAAAAMVANDVARFDVLVTGRAAPGASASVAAEGLATVSVAGTHGTKAYVLAPANYATNGTLDVDLRGQWSAASASDIAICESFVVDVVA